MPDNTAEAPPSLRITEPKNRGWLAANLIAQMAFGMLAMTISLPSMQEWGASFQTSPANVQLTFSAYVLSFGALQLLYGPLSDRHGRRRLLLIGLSLAFFGSVAAALSSSIEALIAARFLQGAGCAACTVIGRASVQDLFEGPERTRVMAYVGMAMGLCPPTGTVLGGQMHVHFGWQSNFVLLAVLALLLIVAALRVMPGQAPQPPGGNQHQLHWLRAMGRAYAQLARQRAYLLNVAILGGTSAAFYIFLGAAPFVLGSYGIGPGSVGFYIMLTPLTYIFGNFLTSRLVRYRSEKWLRQTGLAFTLLSVVLMLLLAAWDVREPLAFSLPLMLFGLGNGLCIPPTLAATVSVVPALAGAAAAVAGVIQQMLGALGAYSVGWVSTATPIPMGLLMAGFVLCAIVAEVALRRR